MVLVLVGSLIALGMFLSALCFCFWLYHQANKAANDSLRAGADIVLEALRSRGDISSPKERQPDTDEPWHIDGGFTTEKVEEPEDAIPDIIVARSERAAKQMGEVGFQDLMEEMTKNESKV